MALKTCPACNKKQGTRTKTCKCGHLFNSHPLVPEPGGWVLDTPKGLPKIEPPRELPVGKMSAPEVYEHVEYNGLGFCIYHLIPASKIKDARLRKLWTDARAVLGKIKEHLDVS